MKKVFLMLMICFFIVGCGQSNNIDNYNENKNINEKTKVKTIADSYEKYSTLKSEAYDMLNDALEENENFNFTLSMGLLGFATVDLTLIPITFCGLEDEAALAGLKFLYSNIDYKYSKDGCKISFTTDEETISYDTVFDKKSDSVRTKMYSNGKLTVISEYIKLGSGYATQFYSKDNDEIFVYKSIFDKDKIIVGKVTNTEEPESIYKNSKIVSENWTKSEELWSKYENGKVTSIYDGEVIEGEL